MSLWILLAATTPGRAFSQEVEAGARQSGTMPERAFFRHIQGSPFAPGELYVRFDAETAERPSRMLAVHASAGALEILWESRRIPGLVRVGIVPGTEQQAIDAYMDTPDVLYASPDYLVRPTVIPNDPDWDQLWGMGNVRARQAWDEFVGDQDFKIAVIDTGLFYLHPDLAENVWTNSGEIAGNGVDDDGNGYVDDVHGWNVVDGNGDILPSMACDDVNHGTHVSGTIAARGNNGIGVVGINWRASIVTLRVGVCCADDGDCSFVNTVEALEYALETGCRVSNNSWGGGGYNQAMYDMIQSGQDDGHIFVAAAGNGGDDDVGDDNDVTPHYPSSYDLDNIIAVAAIKSDDQKAIFSNYGDESVDLCAPGVTIYSTVGQNTYGNFDGTSMATPHVTGAVALLMALHPEDTWEQTKSRIMANVRHVPGMQNFTVSGGVLDVAGAMGIPVGGVWVRFGGFNFFGTYDFPFNNLQDGLDAAGPGGIVNIFPGSGSFTDLIDQSVTLQAPFGGAIIGG